MRGHFRTLAPDFGAVSEAFFGSRGDSSALKVNIKDIHLLPPHFVPHFYKIFHGFIIINQDQLDVARWQQANFVSY